MASKFNKTTGNYHNPKDPLGMHLDSVLLSVNPPEGVGLRDETVTIGREGEWSVDAQADYDRLQAGTPIQGEWMRNKVRSWGVDPDHPERLGYTKRIKVLNKLVRVSRQMYADKMRRMDESILNVNKVNVPQAVYRGTMAEAVIAGKPLECVYMPHGEVGTTIRDLRAILLGEYNLTPEAFTKLDKRKQNKILAKIEALLTRELMAQHPDARGTGATTIRIESKLKERNALHHSLEQWALGDLILEKPQGSSLHHLIQYDTENTPGQLARSHINDPDMQIIVVESDWARALAGKNIDHGHVPLPFENICWEFRISGVRVLAFTCEEMHKPDALYCVYGRDGQWVIDDYMYDIREGRTTARPHRTDVKNVEFDRVAKLVHAEIRAACVMIDASLASRERVEASPALNRQRSRTGKTPLRDHFVVRLLKPRRAVTHRGDAPRSARQDGDPWKQRGHFRIGNWYYYDDPDSGKEQIPNDGGFIISRTWRSWYFAGDPNNIITKEYRL